MSRVQTNMRLLLLVLSFPRSDSNNLKSQEKSCILPQSDRPSIVVRRGSPLAGLGNIMSNYASLLALKVLYNFQVFAIQSELERLQYFIPHLEIEMAEERICNFSQDYKAYDKLVWEEREKRIIQLLRNLTKDNSFDFVVDQKGERTLVLPPEHKDAFYALTQSP